MTDYVGFANEYGPIRSFASYTPWSASHDFLRTWEVVRVNTMADIMRCYELWCLVRESAKCESGALLEVGVWRGGTGAVIAASARGIGLMSPIFLCDTFTGLVKCAPGELWRDGDFADASASGVEALMESLALSNVTIVPGVFPDQSAGIVGEGPFRFVHIDVDTRHSAQGALEWVWPHLVAGAIVVFDDYGFSECHGVRRLVDSWSSRPDLTMLYNINGHAVFVKR